MPPSWDRRADGVLAHRLDQAEVEQLDDVVESAALGRKHIAGLDVAVDQTDLMGLTQALAGLPQQVNDALGR